MAIRTHCAHGELGDFVIEGDHAFDDDAPLRDARSGGGIVPRGLDFLRAVHFRLPLAGERHQRLDEAGVADHLNRGAQLCQAVGKLIRRDRQAQRFGNEAADTFAVHREPCGTRSRYHARQPFLFDLHQHVGGDRLDLRHDEVRFFLLDQRAQLRPVHHVDDARMVRHLLTGRIGVTVHGDGFHTETLQRDDDFLAKLATAEQHHADGGRGKRGADDQRFWLDSHAVCLDVFGLREIIHIDMRFFCAATGVI